MHTINDALTSDDLERLRGYDSPTVANAIETFGVRSRTAGNASPEIRCMIPHFGVTVGYAITGRMRASAPGPQTDPVLGPSALSEGPCLGR